MYERRKGGDQVTRGIASILSPEKPRRSRGNKFPGLQPTPSRKQKNTKTKGTCSSLHKPSRPTEVSFNLMPNSYHRIEHGRTSNLQYHQKSLKQLTKLHSLDRHAAKTRQLTNKYSENDDFSDFDYYFLFDNRIVPIINSDERRVVHRYFNDSLSTQDRYWKNLDKTTDGFKKQMKECEVMTDQVVRDDISIQTEKTYKLEKETSTEGLIVQTQPVEPSKPIKKEYLSFDYFLTKLYFLYLPEDRHFQSLTCVEKYHYRYLFMILAEKIAPKNVPIKPPDAYATPLAFHQINHEIAMYIQYRIGQQMSCMDIPSDGGIPTNLLSILSYLSNLFCFIYLQYKQYLIKGVNTPYGLYNNERYYMLIHGKPLQKSERVLPEYVYYEFEKYFFMAEGEDPMALEAVHIHNKVIFDCMNDELNVFRPFYSCKGYPFLWYTPGKITFFSISYDDVELVLEKVKVKVLEYASYLCGIHCKQREQGRICDNPVVKDVRAERYRKLVCYDIQQLDESTEIYDFRTAMLLYFGYLVLAKLLTEECRYLAKVINR